MPGKHRRSTDYDAGQPGTERLSMHDLLAQHRDFENTGPIPRQGAGRHREPEPELDPFDPPTDVVSDCGEPQPEPAPQAAWEREPEPVDIREPESWEPAAEWDDGPESDPEREPDPEPESRSERTWSMPTIPISIPSPRRPPQPSWTAAAMCGEHVSRRRNKGRGRHRATGNTGGFQLPKVGEPMFPSASTRLEPAGRLRLDQIESTTGGTVRSVAILAAVATGAVAVAAQDEAEASGSAVEPTGGEHREVRTEPRSAPIPLPEVLTLSRDNTDEVNALSRAVTRDEHSFKAVGTPYLAETGGDRVDRWIAEALGLMGLPMSLAPGVRNIVMKESGGDPNAINLWDSNARKGIPSQGLMQTIPATYQACVLPSLADRPITDPVANITAGVRAMIANHGVKTLADGGRKNAQGRYIGYGGGKVPGQNFISTVTGQLRALPGLL